MALAASRSKLNQNLQGGATMTTTGDFICDTCVVRTLAFLLLMSANGRQSGALAFSRRGWHLSLECGGCRAHVRSLPALEACEVRRDAAHAATDERGAGMWRVR